MTDKLTPQHKLEDKYSYSLGNYKFSLGYHPECGKDRYAYFYEYTGKPLPYLYYQSPCILYDTNDYGFSGALYGGIFSLAILNAAPYATFINTILLPIISLMATVNEAHRLKAYVDTLDARTPSIEAFAMSADFAIIVNEVTAAKVADIVIRLTHTARIILLDYLTVTYICNYYSDFGIDHIVTPMVVNTPIIGSKIGTMIGYGAGYLNWFDDTLVEPDFDTKADFDL